MGSISYIKNIFLRAVTSTTLKTPLLYKEKLLNYGTLNFTKFQISSVLKSCLSVFPAIVRFSCITFLSIVFLLSMSLLAGVTFISYMLRILQTLYYYLLFYCALCVTYIDTCCSKLNKNFYLYYSGHLRV